MVELAEKRSNRQFAPHVAIIYLQWVGATLYLNTLGTTKPYVDRWEELRNEYPLVI